MFPLTRIAVALSGAISVLSASAACAQGAAPTDAPTASTLPAINVNATRAADSLTSKSTVDLKRTLDQTVGSVGFVDADSYQNTYAFTLRDVLKDVPGVFVENRYGQELRLSIRGSGIARSYHTRGLEILQDGIPTNLADGSGDYYQIDPLALQAVQVYKGGNGLAYGASTLGGAIDFVTPTAHTADAPNIVRVEGGSYGTVRTSAQISRVIGPLDFLANFSVNHSTVIAITRRGNTSSSTRTSATGSARPSRRASTSACTSSTSCCRARCRCPTR